MKLNDSVKTLKSVGEQRLALLRKLGVSTILDLLEYFPRDYLDRSVIHKINMLQESQIATIRVRVLGHPQTLRKAARTITKIIFADDTGRIELVWFNQPYMAGNFRQDAEYLISGRVKFALGKLTIENPECEIVPRGTISDNVLSGGRIVPVYSLTSGISQKILRGLIHQALSDTKESIEDFLPSDILAAFNLCDRDFAIRNIHFPESADAYFTARRRLVFEELFVMQAALLNAKGFSRQTTSGFDFTDTSEMLAALPFSLTDDQNKVVGEILGDMAAGYVCNRLIQGDVGSGKTAVAMILCYLAVKNGRQAAVMAPTETLAIQHYQSFCEVFDKLGIKCQILRGSLKAQDKRDIKKSVADGEVDILIGTHALIQDNVKFADLGLVITDEQHRFGVRQRMLLNNKGNRPHVLVMTATPIPRSLAMVLYGDMDISVINQLPPGRQKIDTFCVTGAYRGRIYDFIAKEINKGHQAYIVCPLIEESESENFKELNSVLEYAEKLKSGVFADIPLAVLHGRLKSEEKAIIMESFARGETKLLVATTVIEVGINVPIATVILIENAERFGLSQLHQLRGRVGRSDKKSYCILVTDADNSVTKKRMDAMVATGDGFELSELDLEIRGPGEFFGTMQHGIPQMRLANLYKDLPVLEETKSAIAGLIRDYGEMFHVEHKPLADKITKLLGDASISL